MYRLIWFKVLHPAGPLDQMQRRSLGSGPPGLLYTSHQLFHRRGRVKHRERKSSVYNLWFDPLILFSVSLPAPHLSKSHSLPPPPGWIFQGSRLAESVPVASQTAAHYLKHVWLPGARLDEGDE